MLPVNLGQGTDDETLIGYKDAIHVAAILCMTSDQRVKPGSRVIFSRDEDEKAEFRRVNVVRDYVGDNADYDGTMEYHGIVDPFVETDKWGQVAHTVFWVLLNPKYVGKMNHNFGIEISPTEIVELSDCDLRGCD